jgi:hypothetical protein
MTEGLMVIAAGLLVVLCIMLSMFVFIEVILKFDQVLRDRSERASALSDATGAGSAPAVDSEASRNGDEVIAAIGLALQKHLAGGVLRSKTPSTGAGLTPWASSGRMQIMAERQRVTGHRS